MLNTKRKKLSKGAVSVFLFIFLGISSAFATQPAAPPPSPSVHHHKAKTVHHSKKIKHVYRHKYKRHPFVFHPVPLPEFAISPIPAFQSFQNSVYVDATAAVGTPYRWGGTSPDGFDCSGFSQYVYKQEGVEIPRTAAEQFASLTPVNQLQLGDLVFFNLHDQGISHVGIYIGQGKFIHSPTSGEVIRIDDLYNPYWKDHYAGARRVITWHTINNFNNQEPAAASVPRMETVYPADANT